MTTPFDLPVLVTGASGHLGRLVLDALLATPGVDPARIVAGSRDPSKLAGYAARGLRTVPLDFDDPASMDRAFRGIGAVLMIASDRMDGPGARLRQHEVAVASAARAGVRHLLYTSGPGTADDNPLPLTADHLGTERAIAASGMAYTLLRHSLWFENFLRTLPSAIARGTWATATAGGRSSDVSREDCARVDAAALLSAGDENRTLNVTGPSAPTRAELAAIVAAATGRPLAHAEISAEALRQGLSAAGLPPFLAEVMAGFDLAIAQGFHAITTDTVERMTGRKPETAESFFARHAAAFAA